MGSVQLQLRIFLSHFKLWPRARPTRNCPSVGGLITAENLEIALLLCADSTCCWTPCSILQPCVKEGQFFIAARCLAQLRGCCAAAGQGMQTHQYARGWVKKQTDYVKFLRSEEVRVHPDTSLAGLKNCQTVASVRRVTSRGSALWICMYHEPQVYPC